jgi:hypothetical protein
MPEESKERSPRKLAKSRRDYLAQAKMLTEDERTQEAAEINKALGIKAPKGSAAATTLDTARPPTFSCSARWGAMLKSRRRSPASGAARSDAITDAGP